jgi:DNA polymerase-3 subunit beta
MIITLEKKEFSDAVSIVSRFAERRSATLPALAGIAIVAGKDGITLRATNLETGVNLSVGGEVTKEGAVALPAQTLRDITNSFTGTGSFSLQNDSDVVTIVAGGAKSTIKTLPYDDFPGLPAPEGKTTMKVPGAVLRSLVTTVAACASPSTVRPELASVFLSAEGGTLKAVATDSFRLAEKKISVEKGIIPFSILIPAKNAMDVVQTIPDDDIELAIDEHLCAFSWKTGTLTTRLVATAYPDYAQIIPKSFSAEATVLRKDFESALKRAAVFSDSFQKVRLGFDAGGKRLSFSARNTDIGESTEETTAQVTGDSIELSFNHRYLYTPLPLIAAESITIASAGMGRPLVIRGVGDASFLYLVMPMNQ